MTMEEQTVEGWYDNRGKRQCLDRILGKLGDRAASRCIGCGTVFSKSVVGAM